MPFRYESLSVDLRHLQYFVAVAEALNVSRAAARLRISQPALSRQIRDLESELGLALFERTTRRLQLTAAARDLLEHGRKVLSGAEAFKQRAQALQGGDVGLLRVGATPQTLERLFPPVLARFARALPRVEVRLIEGAPAALRELLRTGELHLALALHQPEQVHGSRLLASVPLLAVSKPVRESKPRAAEPARRSKTGARDIRELKGKQLLLLARGFGSRDLFDAACRVAGLAPDVYLESTASATLLAFARAGLGTAVIPGTVAFRAEGLDVHAIATRAKLLTADMAMQWNPERALPVYAEHFMDQLAAEAARTYGQLNT